MYNDSEILSFCEENDVKFIKLALCDVFGRQKNVSIMASELPRALAGEISFDASAVAGFGDVARSDLFLAPDKSSLALLPWRPSHGRVARFYCDVVTADGAPHPSDCRALLRDAAARAESEGLSFEFGAESEFYLFLTDESGAPTLTPVDRAGYIDAAPDDRCENVRREICLTLDEMGISVERSHHEEGPGQNEIDFRYSDALTCADNTVTFRAAVSAVAARNGLHASFDPKPMPHESGSGFHINLSLARDHDGERLQSVLAGILRRARETAVFFNPSRRSYERLGSDKAPCSVSWSHENRSALVRIPASRGSSSRVELRSPDGLCNPYLAFALLIEAGLEGARDGLTPPPESSGDLFARSGAAELLPADLTEALALARSSEFLQSALPQGIFAAYLARGNTRAQR